MPVNGNNQEETFITVLVDSAINDYPPVSFYAEDNAAVAKLFAPLMEDVYVKKISSSELEISIPDNGEQKIMLVTVPYESRWKAATGNETLNTVKVWNTFLGVELIPGIKNVRLEYR